MKTIINTYDLKIVQKKINALQRKFNTDPHYKNLIALKRAYHKLLKHSHPSKQTIQSVVGLLLKLDSTLLSDGDAKLDNDDEYPNDDKGFFTRKGIKKAIKNGDIYDRDSMDYDPSDINQEQFDCVEISEDTISKYKNCKYFAIIDDMDENMIAELPPRKFTMKYVKRVFKDMYPEEKIDTRSIYPSKFMKQALQIILQNRIFAGSNAKDLQIISKKLFTQHGYADRRSRIHLSLYHILKLMKRHSKHLIDYNYNGTSIIKAQDLFNAYCSRVSKLYAKKASPRRDDKLQDDLDNLNELTEIKKNRYLMFNQNINAFDLLTHHPDLLALILMQALGVKLN